MRKSARILAVAALLMVQPLQMMSNAANFGAATSYPVGASPSGITLGDFNGDGKVDIAVANSGSGNVSLLLAKGDGTFQPAVNVSAGQIPWALVATDLNGDGRLDLAVADQTGSVVVLLGRGDGTFQSPVTIPLDASPRSIVAADFNGDGKQDLAVGQFDVNTTTGHATILIGNGDGTFESPATVPLAGAIPYGLAVGDFDGDHRTDLVATGFAPLLSILKGNGDGTFQPAQVISLPSGNSTYSLAAGDLNHDGFLDLFVTNQSFCLKQPCSFNGFAVLLGNGDGTFHSTPVPSDTNGYNKTTTLGVADFDNDGNPDLALTSWDGVTGSALIALGNGDGTFQGLTEITLGANPGAIAAADFNGDGLPDLAVPLISGDSVVVLLNTGKNPVLQLAVVDTGQGSGAVTSDPAGIACGSTCSVDFPSGTQVSLAATPASGSVFGSWSGSCTGSDPPGCTVILNSAQSVRATFNLISDFAITPASVNLSVKRGSAATDALAFEAQGGFVGTISLTCSVSGPSPVPNCSVSPVSVNPGETAILTVDATAITASRDESSPFAGSIFLYAVVLPIFGCLGRLSRKNKRRRDWLGLLFVGVAWVVWACGGGGGGSAPNPPAGGASPSNYVVSVTGTSGALEHSSTISVTLQ